jgi:hypothetical protein
MLQPKNTGNITQPQNISIIIIIIIIITITSNITSIISLPGVEFFDNN